MPFTIDKNDKGEFCVYKADGDGNPTGKTRGCHKTKNEAVAQIGAIESSMAENEKKSLNFYVRSEPFTLTDSSTNIFMPPYDTSGNTFYPPEWYELDEDSGTYVIKKRVRPEVGGGVDVDKLKDSDYVFADERKFPVVIPKDVRDAVNSWGRYKGKKTFEQFKRRLISLAKRKGAKFVAALPEEWKKDMKKSAEELDSTQEDTEKMETPEITEVENVQEVTPEETEPETEKADPLFALKSLGEKRVGAYGVLWGDKYAKDLHKEYFDQETRDMLAIFKAMGKIPLIVHHGQDDAIKTFVYGEVDVMEPDDVGIWYEAKIKEFEVYYNYVKPLMDEHKMFSSSGTLPAAKRVEPDGHITRWPIAEMTNTWLPAEYRMLNRPLSEIKSAYNEIGIDLPELDKKPDEGQKESDEVQEETAVKGAEKARLEILIDQELQKLILSEIEL